MTAVKKLALVAFGYALAVGGGLAAVAVNELRMPADIAQTSPGMVAFGDAVLFILAAGVLSLAPSWFLLKLIAERVPRALLTGELLIAAVGPLSWLLVIWLAARLPGHASAGMQILGPFVAFGAIPRIVLGPILVAIEAATFFLIRGRLTRTLLAAAMLMDIIPCGLFALHMAGAIRH